MKALLIISHGSRRTDSNDEVRRLTDRIRENAGPAFDHVACSFLELTSPLLESAIADLADAGVTEIIVFPYFLAAGTHVHHDIPNRIEEEKANHPQIQFEILPHLGALQGISTLILNHIDNINPAAN